MNASVSHSVLVIVGPGQPVSDMEGSSSSNPDCVPTGRNPVTVRTKSLESMYHLNKLWFAKCKHLWRQLIRLNRRNPTKQKHIGLEFMWPIHTDVPLEKDKHQSVKRARTVIHKSITYIKNCFANFWLLGYNYNYINNCREK